VQLQSPQDFAGPTTYLTDCVRREVMSFQDPQDMLGLPA